jgi:hypothetical protein
MFILIQLIYFQLQTLVGREGNPPGEAGLHHYRTRTTPWSAAQASFLEYILLLILFFIGIPRVLDPDSIRSVDPDPDPYSESRSGSRRAKITHKSRKNLEISCFEVLDALF